MSNIIHAFPIPVSLGDTPATPKAIRAVEIDGKPWFVAADVCKVLGLEGYTSQHTQRLSSDEKLVISRAQNTRLDVFRPKQPTATLVSEPGLYALIARSDKSAARAFDRWMRHDVLPAIRKDGAYVSGKEKVASGELSEDDFILRAFEILRTKVDRLRVENQRLTEELTIVTLDE